MPPDMASPVPPESITEGLLQDLVDRFNHILDQFSKEMAVHRQVAAVLERSAYLCGGATVLVKSDPAAGEIEDVQVLF